MIALKRNRLFLNQKRRSHRSKDIPGGTENYGRGIKSA
jgi:hypothetical protein